MTMVMKVLAPGTKQRENPLVKLLKTKRRPVLKKQLLAVYNSVARKQDEEGRVLSELFMRLPSAKHYPEYYVVIKEPIDLREILGRIRSGEFPEFDDLGKAMELLVSNALTFNEEGSQVYSVSGGQETKWLWVEWVGMCGFQVGKNVWAEWVGMCGQSG